MKLCITALMTNESLLLNKIRHELAQRVQQPLKIQEVGRLLFGTS